MACSSRTAVGASVPPLAPLPASFARPIQHFDRLSRLDVSVDDPVLVSRLESIRHLDSELQIDATERGRPERCDPESNAMALTIRGYELLELLEPVLHDPDPIGNGTGVASDHEEPLSVGRDIVVRPVRFIPAVEEMPGRTRGESSPGALWPLPSSRHRA